MDKTEDTNTYVIPAIIAQKSNYFNFGRPVVGFVNEHAVEVGPLFAIVEEPEKIKEAKPTFLKQLFEKFEKAFL